jgi:hypothetical protein
MKLLLLEVETEECLTEINMEEIGDVRLEIWDWRCEVWGLKQNLSQYSIRNTHYSKSVIWGMRSEAWSMKKAVNLN